MITEWSDSSVANDNLLIEKKNREDETQVAFRKTTTKGHTSVLQKGEGKSPVVLQKEEDDDEGMRDNFTAVKFPRQFF